MRIEELTRQIAAQQTDAVNAQEGHAVLAVDSGSGETTPHIIAPYIRSGWRDDGKEPENLPDVVVCSDGWSLHMHLSQQAPTVNNSGWSYHQSISRAQQRSTPYLIVGDCVHDSDDTDSANRQ